MELSNDLTPEERAKIMFVLKKEEEVKNQEKNYINELLQKIENIENQSISIEDEMKNKNVCSRCGVYSSSIYLFFVPFKYCTNCQRRICYPCGVMTAEHVLICVYCDLRHKLRGISGSWFAASLTEPSVKSFKTAVDNQTIDIKSLDKQSDYKTIDSQTLSKQTDYKPDSKVNKQTLEQKSTCTKSIITNDIINESVSNFKSLDNEAHDFNPQFNNNNSRNNFVNSNSVNKSVDSNFNNNINNLINNSNKINNDINDKQRKTIDSVFEAVTPESAQQNTDAPQIRPQSKHSQNNQSNTFIDNNDLSDINSDKLLIDDEISKLIADYNNEQCVSTHAQILEKIEPIKQSTDINIDKNLDLKNNSNLITNLNDESTNIYNIKNAAARGDEPPTAEIPVSTKNVEQEKAAAVAANAAVLNEPLHKNVINENITKPTAHDQKIDQINIKHIESNINNINNLNIYDNIINNNIDNKVNDKNIENNFNSNNDIKNDARENITRESSAHDQNISEHAQNVPAINLSPRPKSTTETDFKKPAEIIPPLLTPPNLTPPFSETVNIFGTLHGMIKIEKIDSRAKIKVKIIEAVNLKPLIPTTPITSYIVCQAKSLSEKIFKKKTPIVHDCSAPVWGETFEFYYPSHDISKLVIFLLVKKPAEKSRLKNLLKKDHYDKLIYGSVRIGAAKYLTDAEVAVWKKLDENLQKNCAEWIEFKNPLNRLESPDLGSGSSIPASPMLSPRVESQIDITPNSASTSFSGASLTPGSKTAGANTASASKIELNSNSNITSNLSSNFNINNNLNNNNLNINIDSKTESKSSSKNNSQILYDNFNQNDSMISESKTEKSHQNDDTISFISLSSHYFAESNISGTLLINFKYNSTDKLLTVIISKAEEYVFSHKQHSKIFIKTKIIPKISNNEKKTSSKFKDTGTVEFNLTYQFHFDPILDNDTYFICKLFRAETLISKKFIGQVMIPANYILSKNQNELINGFSDYYLLQPKIPYAKYGFKGTITLSTRIDPMSSDGKFGNLEVRVLKANNLNFNNKSDHLDTYVMCSLLPRTDKKTRNKSQVVKNSSDPEYKFCCTFSNIDIFDLKSHRCLEVTIWTNKSKFVGGTRIGSHHTDYYNENWQDSSKLESDLWENMINNSKEWVFGTIPLRYCMLSQNIFKNLSTNIDKLFQMFSSKGRVLFFDITYCTTGKHCFKINLKHVQGISAYNKTIFCKILSSSGGIVTKSFTQYIESENESEWNRNIVVELTEPIDTASLEFRIRSHKKSKDILEKDGTVFGRVLLSKAISTNEWNLPTQDEVDFFNKLIKNPNVCFPAQLNINEFTKPKKINKKNDKPKEERKSNVFHLTSKFQEKVLSTSEIQRNVFDKWKSNKSNKIYGKTRFGTPTLKHKETKAESVDEFTHFQLKSLEDNKTESNSSISQQKINENSQPDKSKDNEKSNKITESDPTINYKNNIESICKNNIETKHFVTNSKIQQNSQTENVTNIKPEIIKSDISISEDKKSPIFPSSENKEVKVVPEKAKENTVDMYINKSDTIHTVSFDSENNKASQNEILLQENTVEKVEVVQTPIKILTEPEKVIKENSISEKTDMYDKEKIETKKTEKISEIVKSEIICEDVSKTIIEDQIKINNEHNKIKNNDIETKIVKETLEVNKIEFKKDKVEEKSQEIINAGNKNIESSLIDSKSSENVKPLTQISIDSHDSNTIEKFEDKKTEVSENKNKKVRNDSIHYNADESQQSTYLPEKSEENKASKTNDFYKLDSIDLDHASSIDSKTYTETSNNLQSVNESVANADSSSISNIHESFQEQESFDQDVDQKKSSKKKIGLTKSIKESVFRRRSMVGSTSKQEDRSTIDSRSSKVSHDSTTSDFNQRHSVFDTKSLFTSSNITGKLLMGLKYSTSESKLEIIIKNAVDVTPHDPKKEKNDTYAKITVFPDKSKLAEFKTKVIKGTLQPVFNESFYYSVNQTDLKLRKVIVNLYHKGLTKNTFLGQVIIPIEGMIESLKNSQYYENWYSLEPKVDLADVTAEPVTPSEFNLTVSLKDLTYDKSKKKSKNDAILTLKILSAANLATSQTVSKAYCKVYLLSDKSHEEKKTTNPVDNKAGTFTWNEEISFEIKKETLSTNGIFIKICDHKKTSYTMSSLKLNDGSKKYEWQDSNPTEVEIWKKICSLSNSSQDFAVQLRREEIK